MSLDLRGPVEESLRRPAHQRAVDANTTPLRGWNWIWPKLLAVGLVISLSRSDSPARRERGCCVPHVGTGDVRLKPILARFDTDG